MRVDRRFHAVIQVGEESTKYRSILLILIISNRIGFVGIVNTWCLINYGVDQIVLARFFGLDFFECQKI